jgi:hypothetical protein
MHLFYVINKKSSNRILKSTNGMYILKEIQYKEIFSSLGKDLYLRIILINIRYQIKDFIFHIIFNNLILEANL